MTKPAAKHTKQPQSDKPTGNSKKDTYASWESQYPDHVIIKKEGAFWTVRGKSAKKLRDLLGYKLGGSPESPMTGSPSLAPMVRALKDNGIKYIVVENGWIIDRKG